MAAHPLLSGLRDIRVGAGLSQQAMATALRMPGGQPYISRLEVGGHDPLLATVSDWAAALGYELVLRKREAA